MDESKLVEILARGKAIFVSKRLVKTAVFRKTAALCNGGKREPFPYQIARADHSLLQQHLVDRNAGLFSELPLQIILREEHGAAVAAARACAMPFSGVDLIRARRGFFLLECNPSPMFAVFEEKTGFNIAQPLAQLLLRR